MGAEAIPDWMRIPQGQWTADDLDLVPEEVGRCEVLDGALIVMSPQRPFHATTSRRLANAIELAAPPGWRIYENFTVRLDDHNRLDPDVVAIRPSPTFDGIKAWCLAKDAGLVVEVVSPDSKVRDRVIKPEKCAAAGIPHYWRIEEVHGAPLVHFLELNSRGQYVETAVEDGKIHLDQPFPLYLDIDRLYP